MSSSEKFAAIELATGTIAIVHGVLEMFELCNGLTLSCEIEDAGILLNARSFVGEFIFAISFSCLILEIR